MNALYVVGGRQRSLRPLLADERLWYEYDRGLIFRLDVASGTLEPCLEYVSPDRVAPPHNPSILFKCATIEGDRLYACTQTEVLVYALPSFALLHSLSLPSFNDVHQVRPAGNGNLLVASSGIDLVLEIRPDGEVVNAWHTLGEDPWALIGNGVDHRMRNTKPHRSHPNFVFQLGDEVWATRFQQKDALCLTDPTRRIPLGIEKPHDGLVHDGRIYFTTVDGHVIVVDQHSLSFERVIDLNAFHNRDAQLGWCRGILVDGPRIWVGFSRIRPTKWRENVGWLARGFKWVCPTHLACYDLERQRVVAEVDLEPYQMNAVFSILPAPSTGASPAAPVRGRERTNDRCGR